MINNHNPVSIIPQYGEDGIRFIDPEAVISQLEIQDGAKIADFGCGAGHFSLALAKRSGENGTVYAFDILSGKLEAVESQAKNLGLNNIQTKRVNLEKIGGSKLPDGSIDLVIMKDMLFQNKDKRTILAEAERILRDKGQALVIEWKKGEGSIGPNQELRMTKEDLAGTAQEAGFCVLKDIAAGNFHYALLLAK